MPITVTDLRTDTRVAPRGIDSPRPEFSWAVDADQLSYELEVSSSRSFEEGSLVWASGRVESGQPFAVPYGGSPLASRTVYSWRVRVHSRTEASGWSEPATFETGLLDQKDWAAAWVTEAPRPKKSPARTQYFFGAVDVPAGTIVRARTYSSALGWYRLYVNGEDQTGPDLVPAVHSVR